MAFIRFAFLADNEVFYISNMEENHPTAQKWIAAFRSNVNMIKANNYSNIHQGYFYKNGQFYDPDDINMQNPLPEQMIDQADTSRYAGVVDGEVVGFMTFMKSDMLEGEFEMVEAGMSSNPIVIEITNNAVSLGWMWNGTEFIPPYEV